MLWQLKLKSWETMWKIEIRCCHPSKNSEDIAPSASCSTQEESVVEQLGK